MNIAVLAGGISAEKEVSVRSGENVAHALKKAGFEVDIYDPSDNNFSFENLQKYNAIYPILHGTKGEDGVIQGIFEFHNLPYVGCGVMSSAITMDKSMSKNLFRACGISCPEGFATTENLKTILTQIDTIGYPVFVKPVCEGSSVGAQVLHNKEEALKFLPDHLKKFPYSLIETYTIGREMTVGVIQMNNELIILPILELKPKAEFYDYNTKYTEGMTEFVLPAPMDQATLHQIHNDVKKIFKAFHLRDCIRVDLILTEKGPVYLEVNTAPGMTVTSDIPAMLEAANIPITDFVTCMINNALENNRCR